MRTVVAAGLAVIAIVTAIVLGNRARQWNDELALASPPLAGEPPHTGDPQTPRLTGRVVLVIVDGLGAGESQLPFLDELRQRGLGTTAHVPYPTISRPNYVTILTGVPPRDSGVRANRVYAPVALDTVMDRVQHAGLRVATASDFGLLPSLFARNAPSLSGIPWVEVDTRITAPPPVTWPVDEARRAPSLQALGPLIAELAASDASFLAVLVLDVDRAGHAFGVGDAYRAAARDVDQMLRVGFAGIDLGRDTVIVTADHGHVAPGGHGGDEPEVSTVPLVLAGKGVIHGAVARDAQLIDVAPTIAALLGVPAPGHAEGRALVELLALAPDEAARRSAADATRDRALTEIVDAARARVTTPDPLRLALAIAGLGIAMVLGRFLHRRALVAITPASIAGAIAFAVMLGAIVLLTRGHVSPSYVPSLGRTELLGAIGAGIAMVAQVVTSWLVIRRARAVGRARDATATANGLAFVGLAIALATVGLARAWFSPPFIDVPPPFWMVVVPTLDLAAATCALAAVVVLLVGALRRT